MDINIVMIVVLKEINRKRAQKKIFSRTKHYNFLSFLSPAALPKTTQSSDVDVHGLLKKVMKMLANVRHHVGVLDRRVRVTDSKIKKEVGLIERKIKSEVRAVDQRVGNVNRRINTEVGSIERKIKNNIHSVHDRISREVESIKAG